MSAPVRIRLVGNGIDDDELHRLTRTLCARLREIDGVEAQLATQRAPSGAKSGLEFFAGAILVYVAKEAIGSLVEGFGEGVGREAVAQAVRTIQEAVGYWRANGRNVSIKLEGPNQQPVTLDRPRVDEDAAQKVLAKAGPRPKYALLIGSGKYEPGSGISDLSCVHNDVAQMERLLLSFPDDFTRESVWTVIDRPYHEVLKSIDHMLETARGSTLVLYYSGHGKIHPTTGEYYLTAADSVAGRIPATCIEFRKVISLINDHAVRCVGILLDCCYAGLAIESINMKGGVQDKLAALVKHSGRGAYLIGASSSTEPAFEKPEHGLSAMTRVIIEGVASGRADVTRQGRVSFADLYSYLNDNVTALGNQTPVLGVNAAGEPPIFVHALHPELRKSTSPQTTGSNSKLGTLDQYIKEINERERELERLPDHDLQLGTEALKTHLASGRTLDDILIPAFATVREASRRMLNLRHSDVQLAGGIGLHEGKIVEIETGEDKVLTAALAAYLNALSGRGVHVITAGAKIAKRDAHQMASIHRFLGLTVGVIEGTPRRDEQRRRQYDCDITYGTAEGMGFDYMHDITTRRRNDLWKRRVLDGTSGRRDPVQRGHAYAIIDDADLILIDQASNLCNTIDTFICRLDSFDYEVDEARRSVRLTERGLKRMKQWLRETGVIKSDASRDTYDEDLHDVAVFHYVNNALQAHKVLKRNKDYVVQSGEVVLIDEFTGRIVPGRRYADGLHQALEAREHQPIRSDKIVAPGVFGYFWDYEKLSGMIGPDGSKAGQFVDFYYREVWKRSPTSR